MRHTISVLVENKFGVLTRVAGMFSGRGFNIDTLNVGPTHDPTTSRMTIVVRGDDTVLEQIIKQLNKLVDVIEVQDFRDERIRRPRTGAGARDGRFQDPRRGHADLRHLSRQDRRRAGGNPHHRNHRQRKQDRQVPHADGRFGIIELTRTGKVALPRTHKNH